MKKDLNDELKKAMLKKAKGFDTSETVEEYSGDEGALVLTKKKVTKKYVPPDTQAAKMLLDMNEVTPPSAMTDEELENEKLRLLNLLKAYEKKKEKKDETK